MRLRVVRSGLTEVSPMEIRLVDDEAGEVADRTVQGEQHRQACVGDKDRQAGAGPVGDPSDRHGAQQAEHVRDGQPDPDLGGGQADGAGEEDGTGGQEDTEARGLHDRQHSDPAGRPSLRNHFGHPGPDCRGDFASSHEWCHLVASARRPERGSSA